MRPLILTARLAEEMQHYFDDLRVKHFPAERNCLAAHLTLFHALPGAMRSEIDSLLLETAQSHQPVEGLVSGVRSLGRGVAFSINCPGLERIRSALAQAWHGALTTQDQQKWKPHITVQNKVGPDAARALLRQLQNAFEPIPLRFPGLALWHYDNGPWELAELYSFVIDEQRSKT